MLFKKREKPRDRNHYENQWWDLQKQMWDSYSTIEKLFRQIQHSKATAECFPLNSADQNSEYDHLAELKQSMLCACGTYDGLKSELRMLYNDHHLEMENQFCLNGLYQPKGNCHEALRAIAKSYHEHR